MIAPNEQLGTPARAESERLISELFLSPALDPHSGLPLSYQDRVDRLCLYLMSLPQADLGTKHVMTPGLYSRESTAPAGAFLVSKTHLKEHQFVMTKGVIYMMDENNAPKRYEGFCRGVTPAGTKRVVYIEEEATFITFYPTEKKELREIEAELYQEDRLTASDNPDHVDFLKMAEELGFDPEQIRIESHNPHTRIPMPQGWNKIEIHPSAIEGQGTFAKLRILPGEIIAPAAINRMRTPAGVFTNHSAKPNAKLQAEGSIVYLVATETIFSGIEITLDYRQARAEAVKSDKLLSTN